MNKSRFLAKKNILITPIKKSLLLRIDIIIFINIINSFNFHRRNLEKSVILYPIASKILKYDGKFSQQLYKAMTLLLLATAVL